VLEPQKPAGRAGNPHARLHRKPCPV